MAIEDKLTELQATKTAIKTAIEGKGQSLDGVPFTQYAEKITAIQGGGGSTTPNILTRMAGNVTSFYEWFKGFSDMTDEDLATAGFSKENTQKVTTVQGMFSGCSSITKAPEMDLRNCTTMVSVFNSCSNLTSIPIYDTRKVTNFSSAFWVCNKLEEIPAWDVRSGTSFSYTFNMTGLKRIWFRNIKTSLSFYATGTPLEEESLIHLARECRRMTNTQTLGLMSSVKSVFTDNYVRILSDDEITDDMVKEDEDMSLLKEKVPFVFCESGDEGAITLLSYMNSKNWNVTFP